MNKYCEDPNLPSVANHLAEMIVDYEMTNKIHIENDCDFEVDDEIVTEEEFLQIIDQELDEQNSGNDQMEESNEDISHFSNIQDQLSSNLDEIASPPEHKTHAVTEKANKQAKETLDKMEKIAVAPGEFGGFQNWGKDVFLEEKCFPEKFPYGSGGYLSSCINDQENNMGFAFALTK